MDTQSTTVEVIAPNSQYLGDRFPVEATYGDGVYVRCEGGKTLRFNRSQVKPIHVRDWDNFLLVEGRIDHDKWRAITEFASKLPGFILLGGWTGEAGRMSLKFQLYQASKNLDALWAHARQLSLNAFKPEPTF